MIQHPSLIAGLMVLVCSVVSTTRAESIDLSDLIRRSPFGTGAGTGVSIAATPESLQLHSVAVQGGRTFYSVSDPATRRSYWLEPGVVNDGYLVQDYDPLRETLRLTHQGHPLTVALKRSMVLAQSISPATLPSASSTQPSATPIIPVSDRRTLLAKMSGGK